MPVHSGLAPGKKINAIIRHQLIDLMDLLMVHGTHRKETKAGEVLIHYTNDVVWFRSRNKMPGLSAMNELILRDETFHYEFALHLYKNYLRDEYKLSKSELRNIILGCYEVEKTFVEESMPEL
jgi:hypothetical protein